MIPKLGEVWMVDMCIAGKVRPTVIVLDDAIGVLPSADLVKIKEAMGLAFGL